MPESNPIGTGVPAALVSMMLSPKVCGTSLGYSTSST